MSIMNATIIASDLFRVSYQGIGVGCASANNAAQRIYNTFKACIGVADGIRAYEFYTQSSGMQPFCYRSIKWRLLTIAQGFYLLGTDPNADKQMIKWDIGLNLINIICDIACNNLTRINELNLDEPVVKDVLNKVAIACILGDSVFRLYTLLSRQTVIKDWARGFWQELRQGNYLPLIEGPKQTFYNICNSALAGVLLVKGVENLSLASKTVMNITFEKNTSLATLITAASATAALAIMINDAVHGILDDYGFQTGRVRTFLVRGFSAISGAILTAATAVGMGYASSIAELARSIPPFINSFRDDVNHRAVMTVGLYFSLHHVFQKAITSFIDTLGFGKSELRDFCEWTFTVVSSATLTSLAAIGLGLYEKTNPTFSLVFTLLMIKVTLITGATQLFFAFELASKKPNEKDFGSGLISACFPTIAWIKP